MINRVKFLFAILLVGACLVVPVTAFAGPLKLDVCHIPPGNPDNAHTITISENAVGAHLAHADLTGACNELCAQLCDDGDACTIDDDGDCERVGCPLPKPVDCDDNNLCTINDCDSSSGCSSTPVDCGTEAFCYTGSGGCVPNNCFAATYQGTEYWICQGSRTRTEAMNFCDGEGLQLAYIADAGENAFVVDEALGEFGWTSFSDSSYWIVNSKSDTVLAYAPGEPNGDGVYHHILRYDGTSRYGWNDVPDTYKWGWVCETLDP